MPLSQITKVVEEVEEVAETVEEVAEVVEKVSSEVAQNVPDNEILKEAALLVEKVSQEVEKDAKLTMELMHKVLISSLSLSLIFFLGLMNVHSYISCYPSIDYRPRCLQIFRDFTQYFASKSFLLSWG